MVKTGIWVELHAKPGKEAELEKFLKSAQSLVEQEEGTVAWFAVKMGPSSFGIFDAFADEKGREAHLNGKVAEQLMAKASELLTESPKIQKPEILASKLQGANTASIKKAS